MTPYGVPRYFHATSVMSDTPIRQRAFASPEPPGRAAGAPRETPGRGDREPHTGAQVLLVDDDASILATVSRQLRAFGYTVQTADSCAAALEALRRQRHDLLLCDVRLPDGSGVDILPHAMEGDTTLAVVMMSGVNDVASAKTALARGAYDFLLKPIEPDTLRSSIRGALDRREMRRHKELLERRIREEVALKTEELEREREALRALTVGLPETLINAMEVKDLYLRGHSQRVADLAASIATELGLPAETVEYVRLAGHLHEVGLIGIREEVLNKPGRLTPEEFEHIKAHVRIGMEILSPLKHLGPALEYVHHHHEHWDGTGYPQGLAGEAISIGGRILAAADALDALTSRRAYRAPMTPDAALAHLGRGFAGTLLDPRVYQALCAVVQKRRALEFIE
jgi:putative two-component system response regulator